MVGSTITWKSGLVLYKKKKNQAWSCKRGSKQGSSMVSALGAYVSSCPDFPPEGLSWKLNKLLALAALVPVASQGSKEETRLSC